MAYALEQIAEADVGMGQKDGPWQTTVLLRFSFNQTGEFCVGYLFDLQPS